MKRYAHFILAFFGMAIGTPVMLYFFPNPFSLISLTLLITTLAFWNEWNQVVDTEMLKKYGSLKSFRIDSKQDVKQDLVGIFLGGWVGVAIYGVIIRIL